MNLIWLRIFKSTYRQQFFFSFLMTIGTVDVLLGVLHQHGFLFLLGLNTIGVAIARRWWLVQCNQTLQTSRFQNITFPLLSLLVVSPCFQPPTTDHHCIRLTV